MGRYIKTLLLYSIPLLIAVAVYVVLDPFKVIWHYDNYIPQEPNALTLNMDYVGTTNYDNKRELYNYSSFILGNSRSRCWRVESWKKYIGNDAVCYHYDSHGESMFGIERKVEYLKKHSPDIKNVLMVIDKSVFANPDRENTHTRYLSPQLDGYKNFIGFHVCNFLAFCTPPFFYAYIDNRLTGQVRPYMQVDNIFIHPDYYDPVHNEYLPLRSEQSIREKTFYNAERMKVFEDKQFPDSVSPICIDDRKYEMLANISAIFKKQKTNVKVVINPLYDQIKLNPGDLRTIQSMFGEENVFDFSGVNDITSDYHNYYEESHYRIFIADSLLKVIYHHD